MKILYITESPYSFLGGCWYHRNQVPANGLKSRGHEIRFASMDPNLPEDWFKWPEIVVFSRTYAIDPLPIMRKFKHEGKRIIYEMDDNLWDVNPDNPSVSVSTEKRWQYEHFMSEVDAITTTTENLKKKLLKFNKNVFICPNAIDPEHYKDRDGNKGRLQIGYTGAASHWRDLEIIIDPLLELQGKYDFDFVLQGMVGAPLESEMYTMQQVYAMNLQPEKRRYMESAMNLFQKMRGLKYYHVPFYVPFLHSEALRRCNIDIGLAPLEDNEFNHGKSCLKFYEYASTGSVTLSSDVEPYNKEVGYCAKNNKDDWYKKLEKLIVDEKFRNELYQKQRQWVEQNRWLKVVAPIWEKVFDPNPNASNK